MRPYAASICGLKMHAARTRRRSRAAACVACRSLVLEREAVCVLASCGLLFLSCVFVVVVVLCLCLACGPSGPHLMSKFPQKKKIRTLGPRYTHSSSEKLEKRVECRKGEEKREESPAKYKQKYAFSKEPSVLSVPCMLRNSVRGLKVLAYETLSYEHMRPYVTSE